MNIPRHIREKVGLRLHQRPGHPVEHIKRVVKSVLPNFEHIENLDPVVTTKQNFDDLLIPSNHVSRRSSDTYYVEVDHVLRTHTTAHLPNLLGTRNQFLVTGDVYRREVIDDTHYPVFHQMEGVLVTSQPESDLQNTINHLMERLLPHHRWQMVESHFTFADPSFEVQVELNGRLVELMGGGVLRPEIMEIAGRSGEEAWAFGIGLDRLAMLMFGIPTISKLWECNKEKII